MRKLLLPTPDDGGAPVDPSAAELRDETSGIDNPTTSNPEFD
jgi:hypothetical protein